jgi:MerR family mercuric resistance operon transcriptional regulator
MDAPLTIGQLAHAAGVNVETIRYYQRIGLIEEPPRPARGYRRYPPGAVARIRFIKRAQNLGFTLHEVAELLALNDGDCDEARALAERKQAAIRARIADLQAIQAELETLIEACRKTADGVHRCALIERLDG